MSNHIDEFEKEMIHYARWHRGIRAAWVGVIAIAVLTTCAMWIAKAFDARQEVPPKQVCPDSVAL